MQMTKEMKAQVRAIRDNEAKRIVDENVRLKILLARIINDLHSQQVSLKLKRGWLDPDLEREAREILQAIPH
jgi:hypothetical protein